MSLSNMKPSARVVSIAALIWTTGYGASGLVTTDRLDHADKEPQNWLVYGSTYRSLRYSALDQINDRNVKRLQAAWAFSTGIVDNGLQSTPLVADGVMYVIGSGLQLFALDAATGRQLWKYKYETIEKRPAAKDGAAAGQAQAEIGFAVATAPNRGIALGHGNVYFGTQDNYVLAINAESGKEVWRSHVEDRREFGCRIQSAPLLVKDVVIVGSTGGDAAHRGHLIAFDALNGQQRWRFNTTPGPGEKGSDTWEGDSWKYGGGAPWMTGSYDPDTDLVYWGTSNAYPDYDGSARKGDNLYTDSIVALRRTNGELVWHFQVVPHDVWDYDAAYECILVDLPVSGRQRKLLIHPNKAGYVIVLDRVTGEFISGFKYVDNLNWTTGLDAKGVPQNRREPVLDQMTFICPNLFGARSFNQASFNLKTGLLYNVGIEWCAEITARKTEIQPGRGGLGSGARNKMVPPPSGKVGSHIDAFEPVTGKRIWRVDTKHPIQAAMLSTGGNLLFTGDPEGNFFAMHAKTGEKLWSFATGSGNRGGPISYSVNGRQFIATPSGWGSTIAGRLAELFPELVDAPRSSMIFAFALPEEPPPTSR
jgi:alcohol dehydrogenase (cytochrome c)